MATGTTTFTADVNKTVTIEGEKFTLTPSNIPDNVTVYLNEVQLQNGVPVELSQDMQLTVSVQATPQGELVFSMTGGTVVKIGETVIADGETYTIEQEITAIDITSPVEIPRINVSGENVEKVAINGAEFNNLPQSFIPIPGIDNSVVITGSGDTVPVLHITGTDIETMTINGVDTPLPYKSQVTNDLEIGVSGKIYALDLTGIGAAITIDGTPTEDGNTQFHDVINVDHNLFIKADGTHTLTVDGEDITYIAVNGVEYPTENLPVIIKNAKMTASIVIDGQAPSEVHIVGQYIDSITLDGVTQPVGEGGSVNLEISTSAENHFVSVNGSQPRKLPITVNNGGSTKITMNGDELPNGTYYIQDGVYISASPMPIPINVENPTSIIIDVNGVRYPAQDFTFNVTGPTEIDVRSNMCKLTIDYGDNSYTLYVPQQIITLTAPHRDGWIFDTWSSFNVGIESPKSVRTTIDLSSRSEANLVCHYQRYITCDKPNPWN